MTLEDAVKVLNHYDYMTTPEWRWQARDERARLAKVGGDGTAVERFSEFVAVAIAEKLTREAEPPEKQKAMAAFDGLIDHYAANMPNEMCRYLDELLDLGWDVREAGLEDAKKEAVNHPPHYAGGGIEAIDAIESWGLGFNLGNVVKYIARAGLKDSTKLVEDLKKARWYLDRRIGQLEKEEANG